MERLTFRDADLGFISDTCLLVSSLDPATADFELLRVLLGDALPLLLGEELRSDRVVRGDVDLSDDARGEVVRVVTSPPLLVVIPVDRFVATDGCVGAGGGDRGGCLLLLGTGTTTGFIFLLSVEVDNVDFF